MLLHKPEGVSHGVFECNRRKLIVAIRGEAARCKRLQSIADVLFQDEVLRFGFKNPGTIIDIRSYYTFGTKLPNNPMLAYDKQSILFVWRSSAA